MKRGMGGYTVIKYLLIVVVTGVIVLFGYNGVLVVQEKACETELNDFLLRFQDLGKDLRPGTVKQKNYFFPCNADRAYFIDLEDFNNEQLLDEFPIIREEVKSKTGKNVFFTRRGEIISSFAASSLDIDYPHYLCLQGITGRMSLVVEGQGRSVKLESTCGQTVCGDIKEEMDEQRIIEVFEEAKGWYGGIRDPHKWR